MLKTIDHRLDADVLHLLAAMGHGDVVVLADVNFPAASTAVATAWGRALHLSGLTLPEATEAILSLMPLDRLVADSVCGMRVEADPDRLPPVQVEAQRVIDRLEGPEQRIVAIDRQEFYARAKQAFAVVTTGERRFYGTLLLRKGVIEPDG